MINITQEQLINIKECITYCMNTPSLKRKGIYLKSLLLRKDDESIKDLFYEVYLINKERGL